MLCQKLYNGYNIRDGTQPKRNWLLTTNIHSQELMDGPGGEQASIISSGGPTSKREQQGANPILRPQDILWISLWEDKYCKDGKEFEGMLLYCWKI